MDLLIPDNWLREFIKTNATNKEIAKYLSLCGPSVEKITKTESGDVYSIEVTTNRMDTASIYGIAREASAILPRFNKKAKLASLEAKSNYKFVSKVKYLNTDIDSRLCSRFTAVLIKNVKLSQSPLIVKEKLTASGIRPINNVIDISNYIMLEMGQPVHTFDYNKIERHLMVLRESQKGEEIVTLDDQSYTLSEGDIVIEDASERLIDLCGIMGGKLSAVDENTKNVLLFVQNYNPSYIRKTSMGLAKRSEAAMLFEKGIDSEEVKTGILRGIEMFIKLTKGIPENEILDIYPNPYKEKVIKVSLEEINKKLGIEMPKKAILDILDPLGFAPSWEKNILKVCIPSFRANDINISEDIIEEIARIYGYHNLPSVIMSGVIPDKTKDSPFFFEDKVKNILKGYGGCEIYTLSLVSKEKTSEDSLRLGNPLGSGSEYLRTSPMHSLVDAVKENAREKEAYHLFEMANIYIPKSNDLPEEKMTLAGIFANTEFRESKGIIESLLSELNIKAEYIQEELKDFIPGQRVVIKINGKTVGQLGNLEDGNLIYYEFDMDMLNKSSINIKKYTSIPQYPPQIEDITLSFPEKTKMGEVITQIKLTNKLIENVELKDIFKDNYTFRIWYQDPSKNLNDSEVEEIRKKIIGEIKRKFGGTIKG
jgi:phenylalanyl-tRNA synthetase beta chain